jgi:hypothetical protein
MLQKNFAGRTCKKISPPGTIINFTKKQSLPENQPTGHNHTCYKKQNFAKELAKKSAHRAQS